MANLGFVGLGAMGSRVTKRLLTKGHSVTGYDLFLSMILYPNFGWDEAAYHLEGDPEGRTFAEILVDVVATEVIEPWGGGKWHLEIFRSANPEPEDWNGEM